MDFGVKQERSGGKGVYIMVREKKQGEQVEESEKSFTRRALGFVKRSAGWLADVVACRKRQQSGDCSEKAKSAQELRDKWQNRCPWWGP